MAFTAECILEEFIEAARVYQPTWDSMCEVQVTYDRARKLKAYHALHARPEWRKARAEKARARRAAAKRG